jgi:hypothetical protein
LKSAIAFTWFGREGSSVNVPSPFPKATWSPSTKSLLRSAVNCTPKFCKLVGKTAVWKVPSPLPNKIASGGPPAAISRDRRLDLLPQEKLTAVVHLLQAISDPLAGPVTMGKKIAWTGPA